MSKIFHVISFWYLLLPYAAGVAIQSLFHQSYQTVVVGLVSSILLAAVLLFQTYIFPKRKLSFFTLLILISLLPTISLFRPGTYESGDFNLHIYRIMSFYDSLREGNIMPSWAWNINATYGNPIFIFNYSLPYYLVSLFHFLGFSFVTSMKIMLGSTFFFSGIFMFIAMRRILNNNIAAFLSAVLYLFAPYHLVDFHFRATPGEMTLFMLAPLMFYFVTRFLKEKKFRYLILISIVTLLLSLSHPMVSIAIHALILIFAITLGGVKDKIRTLLALYLAVGLGLIASLYVWLPFLLYLPVMYPQVTEGHPFGPFYQLFYSPYKFGLLFQGPKGELTAPLGYTHLLLVFVGIAVLFRKKLSNKPNPQLTVWIIVLLTLIFLMNPISNLVWNNFKMLWMLSDRLLLPSAICTSFIGGYVAIIFVKKRKTRIFLYAIIFFAVFSTILNWGHRRVIPTMGDSALVQYAPIATNFLEGPGVYFANTKWADKNNFWFEKIPKEHLIITRGDAFVHQIQRESTRHSYLIHAKTSVSIQENTLWYPGWNLKDYGRKVSIYPGKQGVITATLPKGMHYLVFEYEDIPAYKLLKIVGFTIFLALLLLLCISFFGHPKYFTRKI